MRINRDRVRHSLARLLGLFLIHQGHVFGTRSVTCFAIHSRHQSRGIKPRCSGRSAWGTRADVPPRCQRSPRATPSALSATSLELPAAHPSPSECQLFVAPGERIACAPTVRVELKKQRPQTRHTFLYASFRTPNATRMNLAEIGYHN